MFIQIKNLLPREFNRHGLKKEAEALNVINIYKKSAKEILDENVFAGSEAKVYKNKNLYVYAANSSCAQALFLKQALIKDKINISAGKRLVERIIIRI